MTIVLKNHNPIKKNHLQEQAMAHEMRLYQKPTGTRNYFWSLLINTSWRLWHNYLQYLKCDTQK